MKPTGFLRGAAIVLGAICLATSLPASAKVEGDTIILGSAISLTGKYSTNGIHAQNGYELAVAKINEMGGVKVGGKSYKLKVVYYDDESTPARGAQLAERLIKQDGVQYMLGPYSSGLTKAIAPVTEKYKIPMVEAEGASRSLFTQGYKYLFAVLSTSEQYLASSIDAGRRDRREERQEAPGRAHRHGLRERSLLARRTGRCGRRRLQVRHGDRGRRQAAARPFRHVGDADQGEGAQARPAGGLRPLQGRGDGRPADRRDEDRRADDRHDPLRGGQGRSKSSAPRPTTSSARPNGPRR